jgi:ornithine carbamoyltransferase
MKKLLNISDLSKIDFNQILSFAKNIDENSDNCLVDKNLGLIFEKNSTRTRLSFQVGIKQLKGNFIDIRFDELNLNRFESYEDTFEIMSCYLDCIIFRTTDHKKLDLALEFFKKPIINALSDRSHPCQAISDIYTLDEHFGSADNLNIAWMGDINNVLLSLIETLKFLENTKIQIFTDRNIYKKYHEKLSNNKNIEFYFEINDEVLKNVDCVMTDVFNSMNDKENKEQILQKFQVNQLIMSKTKPSSVFMHCLPAKIGSEVSKDVLKGKKSIVINQAKNRMISQRGILKWLDI